MKKFAHVLLILIISNLLLLTNPYGAEELIRIDIYTKVQDPETKEFEIIARVDSKIANDRVDLNWELPQGLVQIKGSDDSVKTKPSVSPKNVSTTPAPNLAPDSITLKTGENVYSIKVRPQGSLEGEIKVNIQTYERDRSYFGSQTAFIQIDKNFDLSSNPTVYKTIKGLVNTKSTLLNASLFFLISFLVLTPLKKLSDRLTPPSSISHHANDSHILEEFAKRKIYKKA